MHAKGLFSLLVTFGYGFGYGQKSRIFATYGYGFGQKKHLRLTPDSHKKQLLMSVYKL